MSKIVTYPGGYPGPQVSLAGGEVGWDEEWEHFIIQ